jgi:hypothetical protein
MLNARSTNLPAILTALCVSLSSGQDSSDPVLYQRVLPSILMLQTVRVDSGVSMGRRFMPFDEGLVISSRAAVKGNESIFAGFSDGDAGAIYDIVDNEVRVDLTRKVFRPRSFVKSLQEELRSWTGAIPDLSISWLGVSCFLRNPVRYMLVPDSSFAHELGFGTGQFNLSIDGIKPNTFQEINIALRFALGRTTHVVVRRSDIYYMLGFDLYGKLPWE